MKYRYIDWQEFEAAGANDGETVGVLTLNRPDRKNTLGPRMAMELDTVFSEIRHKTVCVVVITGAGETFCSGSDLKEETLPLERPEDDFGIRSFMFEAAKGGALNRHRSRIAGIDFDHSAEPVRLVRFFFEIEPVVMVGPGVAAFRLQAVSFVVESFTGLGRITAEISMEVLFCNQHRAPRRLPAGAIIDRADGSDTGWISVGLQASVPRSRTGEAYGRADMDAAVVPAVLRLRPLPASLTILTTLWPCAAISISVWDLLSFCLRPTPGNIKWRFVYS